MVYSRARFYSRKYVFRIFLIFLISLIVLQIIQYTNKCHRSGKKVDLRLSKTFVNSLIVVNWQKNIKQVDAYGFSVIKLQAILGRGVGFVKLTGVFSSSSATKMLTKTVTYSMKKGSTGLGYYNSIDAQKTSTPTSRLIGELRCRKGLIVSSIYMEKKQWYSGNMTIANFMRFQGEMNTKIHQIFSRSLPPNFASLASGTLIGAQVQFPAEFKHQLIDTGLIHVVAASGYNLSLVSVYIVSFCKRIFPKKIALGVSLIGIWWYVFLALGTPSIIRAGWMCSIGICALLVGRPYSQFRSLLICVLIMLVFSPLLIVSISFQLSVAATFGVMLFGGKQSVAENASVQKSWWSKFLETLNDNFKTTIGANLLTFPIIAFWFSRVSLISIVANVALLWIVPMVMLFSFVLFVAAIIVPFTASLFSIPVFMLCWIFVRSVNVFSQIPYASVNLDSFPFSYVCIYYTMLFVCRAVGNSRAKHL